MASPQPEPTRSSVTAAQTRAEQGTGLRPLTQGELASGVRHSMGGLALIGALVTILPGVLVYLGLRALGLSIGAAGLVGLVLEFIGCFAYCGWLFRGGRRS